MTSFSQRSAKGSPITLAASGTSDVAVIPGTVFISITYGFPSSEIIMSKRATPRQPQALKHAMAAASAFFAASPGIRAGIICSEAPFVYLLS